MGWGAMQLGKTAKGRKKDDCRRARPREMGASEAPGVSEIIKGDEGFAIKGGARREAGNEVREGIEVTGGIGLCVYQCKNFDFYSS